MAATPADGRPLTSFAISLLICGGVSVACWLASVVTREYSWVDRRLVDRSRGLRVGICRACWGPSCHPRGGTVADQQRWDFHRANPAGDVFCTGLFRYCRHPNYFFEIAQWWVVFAFAAIAAGTPLLWTGLGAVLLTLLFAGSTAFTEWISASLHPEFEAYRRDTSALIPWPTRAKRVARLGESFLPCA